MDICIDFDGTCVTHEFPKVGTDIGAAPVLKRLLKYKHRLILFTMRSNKTLRDGGMVAPFLDDAVSWFKENEIELFGINVNPEQKSWTFSPKAYGDLYIDDAALGIPLITNSEISSRPFVDWVIIEQMLGELGYFVSGLIKSQFIKLEDIEKRMDEN